MSTIPSRNMGKSKKSISENPTVKKPDFRPRQPIVVAVAAAAAAAAAAATVAIRVRATAIAIAINGIAIVTAIVYPSSTLGRWELR